MPLGVEEGGIDGGQEVHHVVTCSYTLAKILLALSSIAKPVWVGGMILPRRVINHDVLRDSG